MGSVFIFLEMVIQSNNSALENPELITNALLFFIRSFIWKTLEILLHGL